MNQRLHSDIAGLRTLLHQQRAMNRTIGFVPTMGFLHQGHQSLITQSREAGNFTVVSIFVNPTQFGPNEDFESYPRDPERDFQLAIDAGADIVWFPEVTDLYPKSAQTFVTPGDLAKRLCGVSRPQFFGGICTVVLKFFNIIAPDKAYFGEKDYQQLAIVRRMAADFYMDLEVVGGATVRDENGLALSSRNAKLNDAQYQRALWLSKSIAAARAAYARGERDPQTVLEHLKTSCPADGIDIDYLEFRDPVDLELVETLADDSRLFIGCWLDGVRLIDNAQITEP